jgi:hypothetical protein
MLIASYFFLRAAVTQVGRSSGHEREDLIYSSGSLDFIFVGFPSSLSLSAAAALISTPSFSLLYKLVV